MTPRPFRLNRLHHVAAATVLAVLASAATLGGALAGVVS
jgi:hypothetical protein